jgi:hypothetical protein
MAQSVSLKLSCTLAGTTKSFTLTGSSEGLKVIDVTIPATTTDKQVEAAFTYADIKAFFCQANGALTIETNNATTPTDTLTIAGTAAKPSGMAYVSDGTSSFGENPFTADVTTLYVTNAGAEEVDFYMVVLNDIMT